MSKGKTDRVAAIAKDLLRLEVNVIVKQGMTARPCPPPPVALLEVANHYFWYLHEAARELAPDAAFEELAELRSGDRTNGSETFDALRTGSRALMERVVWSSDGDDENAAERSAAAARRVVLQRIYRNSSRLSVIAEAERSRAPAGLADCWHATRLELNERFDAIQRLQTDPTVATEIRKAWEVGVETVALQSVIHLDGDVVTRINDAYMGDRFQRLHALHHEACRLSIETWESLAKLLASLLTGGFKALKNAL